MTEGLVDKAIEYIGHPKISSRQKPFFGYLASGATLRMPHIMPLNLILINIRGSMIKDGISLAYSFDHSDEQSRRTAQHFELWGYRAIWKEGWKAVTLHTSGEAYENDKWELYHVDEDFSEIDDLADAFPEKLEELKQEWEALASNYDVFPIDDSSVFAKRRAKSEQDYLFYPTRNFRINTFDSKISIKSKPLIVTADVEISSASDEGVLFTQGSRFGGFTFYVKDQHLVFHYSVHGEKHYSIRSTATIPVGPAQLKFEFVPKENLQGIGVLYINGEKAGEGDLDRIVPGLDARFVMWDELIG